MVTTEVREPPAGSGVPGGDSRRGAGGGRRRSARPPLLWLARVAARRSRVQWRLLAVVGIVALLVGTLLATLTLLLSTTERGAVRDALAVAPAARTDVVLRVDEPRATMAGLRASADRAVGRLLGADAAAAVQATTPYVYAFRDDARLGLGYLGELDGIRDEAELVEGTWPAEGEGSGGVDGDPIPVAVPASGVEPLGLEVGDVLRLESPSRSGDENYPVEIEVVGVYRPTHPRADYWGPDPLSAAGHTPDAIVPGSAGLVRTDAVGPLVVAPGGLDIAAVAVADVHLLYRTDFAGAEVGSLAEIQGRVATADADVPRELADTARRVRLTTDLDRFVGEITAAVLVTRAGIAVSGLLLLLVAIAALLQAARLLVDARSGEHDLMRARGAANRQLLGAAALEAGAVALVTAPAGVLLAPWAYRALAAADVADGMPPTPPIGALTWATGAGVGVLLAAVVLSPLLRAPDTFVEGQQARGRDRRAMLARSGADVLVLALAAVAYWQLSTYRSPLSGSGGSLRIDPVLVVGPAALLLAGALLCVRLLPPAARLAQAFAARGRGLVGPLAAWEIGRRASRATAAVLLLTLALALTTYSQAFLATWTRSQEDQAAFATGPPVRVVDAPGETGLQVAALGVAGAPAAQPVLRTAGLEGTVGPYDPLEEAGLRAVSGRGAEVLALTPEARAMLDRGRVGEVAGSTIAALTNPENPAMGPAEVPAVDLGEDAVGVSVVLGATSTGTTIPAGVTVRLVVRDAAGVHWVLDAQATGVDAPPRRVDLMLEGRSAVVGEEAARDAAARQEPLELVGVYVLLTAVEGPRTGLDRAGLMAVDVTMSEVSALVPGEPAADAPTFEEELAAWDGTGPAPVEPPEGIVRRPVAATSPVEAWPALSINTTARVNKDVPDGALGLRMTGAPLDLVRSPASVTLLAWTPYQLSGAVVTRSLAAALDVGIDDRITVQVPGGRTVAVITGIVDRVPTTRTSDVVVVDYLPLARGIAGAASALGTPVDEWWVDVPDEDVPAFLAALPDDRDGAPAADRATAQVVVAAEARSDPLRVAMPIALWLVTAGAALIAAVGFAMHTVVTVRSRDLEFAQLRAVGLARRRVTAVVALESVLMCGLGAVFGVGVGAALGWLVGPLVAVSADGRRPVPDVVVEIPWPQVLAVVGGLGALVLAVVVAVAWTQRAADPAAVLREETAR